MSELTLDQLEVAWLRHLLLAKKVRHRHTLPWLMQKRCSWLTLKDILTVH